MFVYFVCFSSKEAHNSASSQASSSQSIHPAANESQHLSTLDTRAKTVSDPLPQPTASSAVSSPPSATATKTHSVTSRESASSSAHHSNITAALSTPPDCSQSTSGASAAPQKVSRGGDEAMNIPQTSGPSAGTEGRTDSKEQHQSKPSSRGNEGQSSRDRERDRYYSDSSRDRERHYRDRSQERESDGGRHRYRRDHRDHRYHRSYRDRLPPHDRSYRDWESERRWERTVHHPRERDRDRCSNHYHHYHQYRSRDYWDRERRAQEHPYREESRSRWRLQEDSRESRVMKDKSNGRERDYYSSKEETSSPATVPENSTKSKGSPPRARLSMSESAPNREDQNHKRTGDPQSKERDESSEAHRSKKHKKSKKKKKSKDKDRHCDSG